MKKLTRRICAAVAVASTGLALANTAAAVDLRSWDLKINDVNKRFIVLPAFNNQAVLDKETQLVWERAPSVTPMAFDSARSVCQMTKLGGRMGWRLPALSELRSLIDPAVTDSSVPGLPAGHPFIGVKPALNGLWYWTTASHTTQPTGYRLVIPIHGTAPGAWVFPSSNTYGVWCVRGGASSAD